MKPQKVFKVMLSVGAFVLIFISLSLGQTEKNYVKGKLITFDSNGFWCWFQDERAIVDTANKKLILGAAQSGGNITATVFDLKTNTGVKKTLGSENYDDHAAPGFCLLPKGKYIAMYCDHYDKYYTHYSIYDNSNSTWSASKNFDWNTIPGGTDYTIAYNNIYFLSSEGRLYDFERANARAPNFIFSMDTGKTWKFGGQLATDTNENYNKGYYKYWSNGVDRIDFCCTEQHPRDSTTSIYHGYIKGGKTYSTDGVCADENIFDTLTIPTAKKFTKVFTHGTLVKGDTMGRCWQSDLMRWDDGVIAIIFHARANDSITDHRFFYARYNGKEWKWTYLCKAGGPLYPDEQDYVGLGALCPNDRNTIYLSTTFDPSTGASVGKHEIFKGVTADAGATWQWEAITKNSSVENLRPIVPAWDNKHYALLWCKGTYTKAQDYSLQVVGIIDTQSVIPVAAKTQSHPALHAGCTYRNAASNAVTIGYVLPEDAFVKLRVYSINGKEAAILVNGQATAGEHSVTWMPRSMPAGMYFGKMTAGGVSHVLRFQLLGN